jgi:hypothetical protein
VLRNFGYDNDLKLKGDFLPVPSKIAPDQVILSSIVMEISQCLPVWLKWKRLE